MPLVQRTLELDADLVTNAEAEGVDLSRELEAALKRRLWSFVASAERKARDPAAAEARARRWAEENADAIKAYNERIEREGLALEEFRRF